MRKCTCIENEIKWYKIMRGWVFESIESHNNNNQMILKYIKNSVRALVNTIIKWNNNDAMKWGRGWEDMKIFMCIEQQRQTAKMLTKKNNNKMGKCHWKCLYGFQLYRRRGWEWGGMNVECEGKMKKIE